MNKVIAKKRLEKLRKEINIHRYNYHVLDQETMNPVALDSLKNELSKLENEFPDLITPDSPSQRVAGKALTKFKKAVHSQAMVSLFDAFSEKDIRDWEDKNSNYLKRKLKTDYYCELKLDGLALSLKYKQLLLVQGATRGNGRVGEDVTENSRTINSIPLRLRIPYRDELLSLGFSLAQTEIIITQIKMGIVEVRGEVIMPRKVFNELNQKYQQENKAPLINTRNGVAGSLRQLDPHITAARKLDFYAYDLLLNEQLRKIIRTRYQANALVGLLGFKTLVQNKVCHSLDEVFSFYRQAIKIRDKLDFGIDGVVIKINELRLWSILGIVGKAPRYMMAYKFPAEQVTTRVIDLVWQVGRTGVLTPTAILEPVFVGGATISRSTLHNYDEIRRLGLKIGDTVIIERSGDVIPKVIKVLTKLRIGIEKSIRRPAVCPRCGETISQTGTEVAYRCRNKNCYAVNLRQISHFVSKGAVDLPGLGPQVIDQLMGVGLIEDAADLYTLRKEDLLNLERFADKKATNIIRTIASHREIELSRFIYALGIEQVGEETARLLAEKIRQTEKNRTIKVADLVKKFQNISKTELAELEDIGPIVAESIVSFWRDQHKLELLKKFSNNGIIIRIREDNQAQKQTLAGLNFVLTGTLTSLTREEAKARIRNRGAKVRASISKEINFVVAGNNPGTKYNQAQKLGLKIITEVEFLELIK